MGAGQSDLISADAIVNESGSLIIAGVPIGNPSTVVIWDVSPLPTNNQDTIQMKIGIAPLPSVLLGWHDGSGKDTKMGIDTSSHISSTEAKAQPTDAESPPLFCSPISNLSAYVTPEVSKATVNGLGSGVASIAFDPSKAGSVLVVLLNEGM